MFKKIILLSLRNNKLLACLQTTGFFLIYILIDWTYPDLFLDMKKLSSSSFAGIISYILESLFYHNIIQTIFILILLDVLWNGYIFYLFKRKSLFQTLYISGYSKGTVGLYILLEHTLMCIIPMLLSSLIYHQVCFLTSSVAYSCSLLFELFILLIYEIMLGIYYEKNYFKLLQ